MEFYMYLLVIWSVVRTLTVVNASENIALGKATSQSSVLNNWDSSKAVDRCVTTYVNSNCCTHTAADKTEAWWQVDLQTQFVINTVNIIYRDQSTLERLAGYEIYLSDTSDWTSGTRCHKDTTADLASMSATQNDECPGVAQYLTIYNDRRVKAKTWYSDDAILELCEVKIYGCPVGKYGNGNCNIDCFNCLGDVCDATSGICGTCAVGYYKVGQSCILCPSNCEGNKCDITTGACSDGCSQGYSGIYCRCPANCKDTSCPNGQCTECTNGYYMYGQSCTPCPSGCSTNTCDKTSGHCIYCTDGYYGTFCKKSCSDQCKNKICIKWNGYCQDCHDGYFGPSCESCPSGCSTKTCDKMSGHCTQCKSGFYGSFCNQSCHVNCKHNICNMNKGKCTECDAGFFGDFCNMPCPGNCTNNICNKDNGQCTVCVSGFHGSSCDQSCPANCEPNICNKGNGQCTECSNGFHGSFCNESCPANCSNSVCNMSNGYCNDCISGTYGNTCTHPCPSNCKTDTCEQLNGICKECVPGFHGNFCSQACPINCKNNICHLQDGKCIECVPGFHGNFCSQACPTNCKNNICSLPDGKCIETEALIETPDSQVGTYAGAGVGVVVVIAVVIIVVIVAIRRRKVQTKERKYQHTEYDDDLDNTSSLPPAQPGHRSHVTSKTAMPATNDSRMVYMNVSDVGKKDEEAAYINMDTSGGVSIDDIRAMIPKKMENEEEEFKKEFKELPWGAVHPHLEGSKATNKPKNRFKTTFPYDHSRVILDKIGNDPDSTYINANYIDSTEFRQAYVASQGPKKDTVNDFWRMVWQLNTGKIVMVTNLIEGGNVKCHQYWPDEGSPLVTKHFSIRLDRERTYAFYVLREISLTNKKTKEERQVHQFHFTAWPDHGTPDTLELVLFHRRVASYSTPLTGKMVVHCSAGLGRTGTFIGLDALSKEEKKSGKVDISRFIRKMREDRMNMVQTHEQYIAIHELLVEAHDLTETLISNTDFPVTLRKMIPPGKPTNQTKLRKEFEILHTLIPKYDSSCYSAGMMKENRSKNRTMSIKAVDIYRAYLRSQVGRSDYINAVMIQSHRSKSGYLMTQFPLENTVEDLWTMVNDYNCENIVVLGTPTEHWLREESDTNEAHEIYVKKQNTLEVIPNVDVADYNITSKSSRTEMTVRIFTMKEWSSNLLLPPSTSSLLLLLEQLETRRRSDNTKPVVVMCQDGCTQSGLFCCISNARDQMKMDDEVDIFQTSRQIQVRRPQALRHTEQYQYCYNFIGQYLDSTNIYIN